MNLNKLMKQAQQMQAQMAKAQAELEEKTVEVTAAGGKIKVTANGAGEILSIKIGHEIVDPNDVEQGKALAQSEMKKITGGLGMPGL
jgi:DNA-binding YbaB/EbfC family protein